jgi:hypothetical protein
MINVNDYKTSYIGGSDFKFCKRSTVLSASIVFVLFPSQNHSLSIEPDELAGLKILAKVDLQEEPCCLFRVFNFP